MSNKVSTNNPECACSYSHQNSQTYTPLIVFCNRFLIYALWNKCFKDLPLPPTLTCQFPTCFLSCRFSLKTWKPNVSSYPILVLPLHQTINTITYSLISTIAPGSLISLIPAYWPGTETDQTTWLLQTWYDIVPVNKLVFLKWTSAWNWEILELYIYITKFFDPTLVQRILW